MRGTSICVTLPMTPIPPSTTNMVIIVKMSPVFALGMWKETHNASAMELDCVMFPIPKEAVTAKRAKQVPNKP